MSGGTQGRSQRAEVARREPVSIVVPSLDDRGLLKLSLPPLMAEIERRGAGSEILVVDDTGGGELAAWVERRYRGVRTLAREDNGGFARALLDGVQAAAHELVFSMNPDIRVRPGFLDPLCRAMGDPSVAQAVPKVLLGGDERRIESLTELGEERGLPVLVQRGLGDEGGEAVREGEGEREREVAFAIGGAMLLRREEFLARGGFDPLYEPFYYEDVDLGVAETRAERRVVLCGESVVEHHHRGTIGRVVEPEVVRAVIERNRLLLAMKWCEGEREAEALVGVLRRRAVDAFLRDEREELVWLGLALGEVERVVRARGRRERGAR